MEVADDSVCWSIKVARCEYSDIFKIKRLIIDDVYLYLAIHKYSEEKLVLVITELHLGNNNGLSHPYYKLLDGDSIPSTLLDSLNVKHLVTSIVNLC